MYVRVLVLGLHVFCRGGLRKGKGVFCRASAGAVRWKDARSPLYNRFFLKYIKDKSWYRGVFLTHSVPVYLVNICCFTAKGVFGLSCVWRSGRDMYLKVNEFKCKCTY